MRHVTCVFVKYVTCTYFGYRTYIYDRIQRLGQFSWHKLLSDFPIPDPFQRHATDGKSQSIKLKFAMINMMQNSSELVRKNYIKSGFQGRYVVHEVVGNLPRSRYSAPGQSCKRQDLCFAHTYESIP